MTPVFLGLQHTPHGKPCEPLPPSSPAQTCGCHLGNRTLLQGCCLSWWLLVFGDYTVYNIQGKERLVEQVIIILERYVCAGY